MVDQESECPSCQATGIYQGTLEPPHIGVVCNMCQGSGKVLSQLLKPFKGRKRRNDGVRLVYISISSIRGKYIGNPVTINQFYSGVMPS
mgnify:CR=1 FL=1